MSEKRDDLLEWIESTAIAAEQATGDLRGYVWVCSLTTYMDMVSARALHRCRVSGGLSLYGLPVMSISGYPDGNLDIVHKSDVQRMKDEAMSRLMYLARR